jgi:hypothetical protein
MCELVRQLGFQYYEDIGGWRSPVDGTTLQKDVLFVRDALFTQAAHRPSERATVPATASTDTPKSRELTTA